MARILIIDDDADFCQALGDFLRSQSHEVAVAGSGAEGLAAARSRPDLIICDLAMPGLSGHGVVKALREDEQLADIPFIFLSGAASRETIRQGMNLGGDDFLTKPADLPEILATVQARLDRHSQQEIRQAKAQQAALASPSGAAGGTAGPPPTPVPGALLVAKGKRQFYVSISELRAVVADGEYSTMYWGKHESLMLRKTLKQWERELGGSTFIRIHRNAFINLRYLDYVEKSPDRKLLVRLRDFPEVIKVSQRKRSALNRALKHIRVRDAASLSAPP